MKRLLFSFLFATMSFAQGGGQPINVPIQNPYFEPSAPLSLPDACGVHGSGSLATGWQFNSDTLLFQPSIPNTCGIPAPPNGQTVALIGSSNGISQTLSTSPEHWQANGGNAFDGIYTITFWVTNFYPGYPAYCATKVRYGSQELSDYEIWVTHVWTKVTIPIPSPVHLLYQSEPGGGTGQGKQPLVISFSKPEGWTLLVAGPVSLTFTLTN